MPVQQLVWDGKSESRQNPTVYRAPDASDWQEITKQLQTCQKSVYQATFMAAGQFLLTGQPFYWFNDKIWPAQATDAQLAEVMGVVLSDGDDQVGITTSGRAVREDWTPITGSVHLQTGSIYFLGLTAGMISTSPPTQVGQFIVELGKAISPTTLDVKIKPPIGL